MHIHCDFESRSPIDIKKAGGYAYAEHPDTEVLCLAVKVDDEETEIWVPEQFRQFYGSEISDSTLADLVEQADTISAHNAGGFERPMWTEHMVRRRGFPEIPLERWDDTAARAAMCALPRSLDGATKALGVTAEKDQEGYKLMLKMCKPKALAKKERIALGEHFGISEEDVKMYGAQILSALKVDPRAPQILGQNFKDYRQFYKYHFTPEDFERLCQYCIQDVEAEYALAQELPPLPKMERRIWELDQAINDRGILADLVSVEHAEAIIEEHSSKLQEELRELTGGAVGTAKQVAKMTAWMGENGCEMDGLTKQDVKDALSGEIDPAVRRVLEIRQSLSMSSTAKLAAIRAFACRDGRLRGMFLYHGAGPGRWCMPGDAEVLTPEGWVAMENVRGSKPLMCWDFKGNKLAFLESAMSGFDYSGRMLKVESRFVGGLFTPEHKIPCITSRGYLDCQTAETFSKVRRDVPVSGKYAPGIELRPEIETRLVVMTQADAHICTDKGSGRCVRFKFRKPRKVYRAELLLNIAGIPYTKRVYACGISIKIRWADAPDYMKQAKLFTPEILQHSPTAFVEELKHWDGCIDPRSATSGYSYTTTSKENAEWVATMAHLAGWAATISVRDRKVENWNTAYRVRIRKKEKTRVQVSESEWVDYEGRVYCPETPTGFFLVRYKGKIHITGNSGKGPQPQNFPRGNETLNPEAIIEDWMPRRDLDWLEILWGDPMDVVSSCLRGVFVASPGHDLIAADYSAIEARGLAYLAGEEAVLDAFCNKLDLYKVAASGIYKKPYDRITKTERSVGKTCVLACGYGGSKGAMLAFGADRLGMSDEEIDSAVAAWREANPAIVRFWYALTEACLKTVKEGVETRYRRIGFRMRGKFLQMILPSGRPLWYYAPRIQQVMMPWGKEKEMVTAMTVDSLTKQRVRRPLGHPILSENATQAFCRDLLALGLIRCEAAGYKVIGHVHDEIVAEVPEGWGSVEEMEAIMSEVPKWAEGMPISAEGYRAKRYRK